MTIKNIKVLVGVILSLSLLGTIGCLFQIPDHLVPLMGYWDLAIGEESEHFIFNKVTSVLSNETGEWYTIASGEEEYYDNGELKKREYEAGLVEDYEWKENIVPGYEYFAEIQLYDCENEEYCDLEKIKYYFFNFIADDVIVGVYKRAFSIEPFEGVKSNSITNRVQ